MVAYQGKNMREYLKGVELLQTRPNRAVVPIERKALSVLFETCKSTVGHVVLRTVISEYSNP